MLETLELPSGRELQEAVAQAAESAQQWFSNENNVVENDSTSSNDH